jgi:hypothetical protein
LELDDTIIEIFGENNTILNINKITTITIMITTTTTTTVI